MISLRDDTAQSNLWEIVQVGRDVRLTRFPKLRPARIEGPFGNPPVTITLDLFMRIRLSNIVAMIRNVMARLVEERRGATRPEQGVIHGRLREMQGVAGAALPHGVAGLTSRRRIGATSNEHLMLPTRPALVPNGGSDC